MADHRDATRAQCLYGLDQHRLHHADAGEQIVQHRKEHRHHDDEDDGALPQPEPQDSEGNPGKAGNGLQQIDQRVEEIAAQSMQAHQIAERDGDDASRDEAQHEALQADGQIDQQHARLRIGDEGLGHFERRWEEDLRPDVGR